MSAKSLSRRTTPLSERFTVMLERWDNFRRNNGRFFRPMPIYTPDDKLPVYAEDGVSPELAMLILESHGVYWPTNDAERFAEYIQGKAIEGLSRKQWAEDCITGAFWAEELVIAGLIGFREVEEFTGRRLNGHILWLCASTHGKRRPHDP